MPITRTTAGPGELARIRPSKNRLLFRCKHVGNVAGVSLIHAARESDTANSIMHTLSCREGLRCRRGSRVTFTRKSVERLEERRVVRIGIVQATRERFASPLGVGDQRAADCNEVEFIAFSTVE